MHKIFYEDSCYEKNTPNDFDCCSPWSGCDGVRSACDETDASPDTKHAS